MAAATGTGSSAMPKPYPPGTQLKGIVQPHDHDVLSGRGNFVNYHPGNEHFRALVKRHKVTYVATPKSEKGKYSKLIVDEIRSMDPPGRFLKQDAATKLWTEIGDKKSLDKTRQALREGAPELLKELSGEDPLGGLMPPQAIPSMSGMSGKGGFGGGGGAGVGGELGGGHTLDQQNYFLQQMAQLQAQQQQRAQRQQQQQQQSHNPQLNAVTDSNNFAATAPLSSSNNFVGGMPVGSGVPSGVYSNFSVGVGAIGIGSGQGQYGQQQQQQEYASFPQQQNNNIHNTGAGHGQQAEHAGARVSQAHLSSLIDSIEPLPVNVGANANTNPGSTTDAAAQQERLLAQQQFLKQQQARLAQQQELLRQLQEQQRQMAALSQQQSQQQLQAVRVGSGSVGGGGSGSSRSAGTSLNPTMLHNTLGGQLNNQPIPENATSLPDATQQQPGGESRQPRTNRRGSLTFDQLVDGIKSAKAAQKLGMSSTNMSLSIGDIDSNLSSAFEDSLIISVEGSLSSKSSDKIKKPSPNTASTAEGRAIAAQKGPAAEEAPVETVTAGANNTMGAMGESSMLRGFGASEMGMSFSLEDAAGILGLASEQEQNRAASATEAGVMDMSLAHINTEESK